MTKTRQSGLLIGEGGGTVGYKTLKLRTQGEGNLAEVMRKNGRMLMDMEFENDVSYAPDFFICEGVCPKKPIGIRLYTNKFLTSGGFNIDFSVKIGDSLKVGDLLYDCDENVYWLCKAAYKNAGIYCNGTLLRCIEMPLKWQDSKGKIFEYPVFDFTQFNSDETDYKIVNVGEGKHRLVTIADENTIRLGHDKRFFWSRDRENPSVFKITQNDSTTMFYDKGLIKLTLSEDQYNSSKDDINEWICDYKQVANTELHLQYNGDNYIRVGRSRRVWIDNVNNSEIKWDIQADSRIAVEYGENSVKVFCPMDETLIGEKIVIRATVGDLHSECGFEIIGGV